MSDLNDSAWLSVCATKELMPNIGVRALVGGEQVALFKVRDCYYAISAIDPFTNTAVLARGIVGDQGGKIVVASPIYKQHFALSTGECLEEAGVTVKTYPVRDNNGTIELAVHRL